MVSKIILETGSAQAFHAFTVDGDKTPMKPTGWNVVSYDWYWSPTETGVKYSFRHLKDAEAMIKFF